MSDFNTRTRNLFRSIYRNQRIDLSGSKQTLKQQLDLYLEHLSRHIHKKISDFDQERIWHIIDRDNQVAKVIDSPEYRKITSRKKQLLGPANLALVFCIDGRIPSIFVGGRYTVHWEVPAGEISTIKRKSDGNLIPVSSELCEALRLMVTKEQDLLEIVFGHTSLTGHGCGAMAAKQKNGELSSKLSVEESNINIIEEKTIPPITTVYNEFRTQKGFKPLSRVCISAIYDTDTFGMFFNFQKGPGGYLSTTDLTNKYKDLMDDFFIKLNIVYGSFSEKFSELKFLTVFSGNILNVTEKLLTNKNFQDLASEISEYIDKNYSDLTDNQKQALLFFTVRTIAVQYLTGAASVTKKSIRHPFTHHEEEYMAISTRGSIIGKNDPENQVFGSTPSDAAKAITNIKTKLSIMSSGKHHRNKAYLLFICNPVNKRDLVENSIQLHKVMDANAELLRSIMADKDLGEMILDRDIIPVSVLVEEDTREVLKFVDHSVYI